MERNGYQRSNSNKGMWIKGSRYVQDRKGSQFRSQSGGAGFNRNRSKSGGNGNRNGDRSRSRPPGQKSELAKNVENNGKDIQEIKKQLKEIIEKIDKVKVNHFVEEEYTVNVRYVDEAKGMQMIVDSGAPVLIATSKWIEIYLKEMKVKKEEIMEKECNRKFKIG